MILTQRMMNQVHTWSILYIIAYTIASIVYITRDELYT